MSREPIAVPVSVSTHRLLSDIGDAWIAIDANLEQSGQETTGVYRQTLTQGRRHRPAGAPQGPATRGLIAHRGLRPAVSAAGCCPVAPVQFPVDVAGPG